MGWKQYVPRVPWSKKPDKPVAPQKVEKPRSWRDTAHPDLLALSDSDFTLRSSMFSKWWYPVESQIGWFGDIQMYATMPQYESWVREHPPAKTDHTAGPA